MSNQRPYPGARCLVAIATIALIVALSGPTSVHADGLSCKRLQTRTRELISGIMWPACAKIALSGALPPVWDPSVQGEVIPNGVYNNPTVVREYFYALAGPLVLNDTEQTKPLGRVVDIEYIWMTCDSDSGVVATETFISFADGFGTPSIKIDMIHVYKFNKQRRVCGFSLTSKRQEIVLDSAPGAPSPAAIIPQLCGGIQMFCTGKNAQFPSFQACAAFMAAKPFGNSGSLDQDNVMCRTLHLSLAAVDPDVHCSHVGPTGGGKCVPHGLESQYRVKEFMAC